MRILLDKIMLSKNLTIRQVSNMTGISKSSIQRIMNNEISPSADTLELLAKGLKFTFLTFWIPRINKCPTSGTNPQNRVRFPLVECIYSEGQIKQPFLEQMFEKLLEINYEE